GAAPDFRQDCIAYALLLRARGDGPRRMCDLFPASWEIFRFNCHQSYDEKLTVEPVKTQPDPKSGPGRDDGRESVPVIFGRNVLLAATGEGRFTDKAVEMGVESAGFTWNAKFADLDNDEFVDLYAVNGWFPGTQRTSNVFYRNRQSGGFADDTRAAGLV